MHHVKSKNHFSESRNRSKCHTQILTQINFSYSKVLEYLHARALEYGPALPPMSRGSSPHAMLINSLTGTRNNTAQRLPEDRISDVTPGIQKEEPPSPPNISE